MSSAVRKLARRLHPGSRRRMDVAAAQAAEDALLETRRFAVTDRAAALTYPIAVNCARNEYRQLRPRVVRYYPTKGWRSELAVSGR